MTVSREEFLRICGAFKDTVVVKAVACVQLMFCGFTHMEWTEPRLGFLVLAYRPQHGALTLTLVDTTSFDTLFQQQVFMDMDIAIRDGDFATFETNEGVYGVVFTSADDAEAFCAAFYSCVPPSRHPQWWTFRMNRFENAFFFFFVIVLCVS